jgi:hypothetical protein
VAGLFALSSSPPRPAPAAAAAFEEDGVEKWVCCCWRQKTQRPGLWRLEKKVKKGAYFANVVKGANINNKLLNLFYIFF